MVDVRRYKHLREAIDDIQKVDREYISVRHKLRSGEAVDNHFHPNIEEWVVFDSFGKARLFLDFERVKICDPLGVMAVHIPKGYIHSLKPLTDISYMVFRNRSGYPIELKDVLKRKSSVQQITLKDQVIWQLFDQKKLMLAYVEVTGKDEVSLKHYYSQSKGDEEKYYVSKGRGKVIIDDKELCIKKGDLVTVPHGSSHFLKRARGDPLEVLVITH
jgi:mannose-6-phosphate isomerase-like protein (cupin superfamily)